MKRHRIAQLKRIDRQEETTSVPLSNERAASPLMSSIQDMISSPGQELDDTTRAEMESHFQYDFGSIRIFAGDQATTTARALNAQAFTVGPNIIFDADEYAPASSEGQRLIAHELAHTIQQAQGPVPGTPIGPDLAVSDPFDPFEQAADRMAAHVGTSHTPALPSISTPTLESSENETDQSGTEQPVAEAQESIFDRMAGEAGPLILQRKVVDAANPDDDEDLRRRLLGLEPMGADDRADLHGGIAHEISLDADNAMPPAWLRQIFAEAGDSETDDPDDLNGPSPNMAAPGRTPQQTPTLEPEAAPKAAQPHAPTAVDASNSGAANTSPGTSSVNSTPPPADTASTGAGTAPKSASSQITLEPATAVQASPPAPIPGDAASQAAAATARAQQQVAQVDEDAAAGRAEAEAALAEGASDPLPGLAELLEPPPDGALVDIPEAPPIDPAIIDWGAGQQSADATALLSALPAVAPADSDLNANLAAPEIVPPAASEQPPAPAMPPLVIQRSARPGAETIDVDSDEANAAVEEDDYDPVAARAQVRSIAGVFDTIPGQSQQVMQAQAATTTATLQTTAQSMQQTMQAAVTQRVGNVQNLYTQRRNALQVTLQTTLDQIGSTLQRSIEAANQKGTDAKSRLTKLFTDHRTNVEQAVADTLTTVDELRRTRKAEAGQQIQERANEARQRGAIAAGSYGTDERGQKQGQAASAVADKVAGDIESTRPDVERSIDEITESIPKEVRARGQEALNGIDQGLPDLLRGVDEQVRATIETLNQAARDLTQQIQQMGTLLGVQLNTQEQTTVAGLQGILPQATAQIETHLNLTTPLVNAAVQQAGAQIAQFVSQANATLLGIETPDVDRAQSYAGQVTGFANSAAGDVAGALQEALGPATEQFTLVQSTTDTATQAVETQTGATLDTLAAGIETSLSNLLDGVTTSFTGMVNGLDTAFGEVEGQVNTEFESALNTLTAGFGKTIQDADREVLKAIDSGVAKADEALGGLDGKMSEVAEDAGWRHDHPVLAALKDIGGFVLGLVAGIVAVLALAVVVIVAANLLIAGLVALGLTSFVAGLIVAVIGLGLLAFGIYQAYQARVSAGEGGGWGTFGAAILDVVGITEIYHGFTDPNLTPFERGFGIGRGAATLGTFLLGNRLNARVRGKLPPSIINPTRGSLWNWRARGPLDINVPTQPGRPSWRQSENDVTAALPKDFGTQRSFLGNREVPGGTRGSTRPDNHRPGGLFRPPIAVEVKNYNVINSSRRTALINEVLRQVLQRSVDIRNTPQKIVIDVRGQNPTQQILNEIVQRIVQGSNGILRPDDIQFIQ